MLRNFPCKPEALKKNYNVVAALSSTKSLKVFIPAAVNLLPLTTLHETHPGRRGMTARL